MISLAIFVALSIALPRWLRVAQREHYIPGRVAYISYLWIRVLRRNVVLVFALVLWTLGLPLASQWVLSSRIQRESLATLAVAAPVVIFVIVWPLGLRWRGSEKSKLVWTPRLRRLAAISTTCNAVVAAGVWALAQVPPLVGFAPSLALLSPVYVDVALLLSKPVEARLSARFVERARRRIDQVKPTIIGITGSFGKTSTKQYLTTLLSSKYYTVASPGSFNNLLGLSRTVNDVLADGTEIFVAEMGTYGPGEIRRIAEFFPPKIACITSIGDVHLERMKSRANIARAKSEILATATGVVLCIDYPELNELAHSCKAEGKEVITVSTSDSEKPDVLVANSGQAIVLSYRGKKVGRLESLDGHAGNIGCAVGMALIAGLSLEEVSGQLANLTAVAHRAEVIVRPDGPAIIDDTYNSNPQGALSALEKGSKLAGEAGGILYVVTPGMIELGRSQFDENVALGRQAVKLGSRLFIVGRINRRALLKGATAGRQEIRGVAPAQPVLADSRQDAATQAYAVATFRDVILFENDLPDHYP